MSLVSAPVPRAGDGTGEASIPQQYAALPWRIDREGMLRVLLVTSRRRGRWILPKGWRVKGRSPAQSAAREAFEEAGVIGKPAPDPIGSYRYLKLQDDGSVEPRDVTLFGLQVRGTLLNWPEKGQRKRGWWSIGEAVDIVEEPELADLLRTLEPGSVRG